MSAVAALSVAGLLGLACSSSGLKTIADAGVASGGQAGSTISSGATGGTGGTIGPGGAGGGSIGGTGGTSGPAGTIGTGGSRTDGGTAGSSGTGGTGGQGPICPVYPKCNPGDQQMDMDCPSGRKCYLMGVSCGPVQNTIICAFGVDAGVDAATPDAGLDVRTMRPCGDGVLDPGEQCDDGNTNSGDGCNAFCQIEARWQCPTPGQLCIPCGTNACDAGPVGYCGDGILQTDRAELCDLGPLNGVCLDQQSRTPPDADQGSVGDAGCPLGSWDWDGTQVCNCPAGSRVLCTTTCQYPYYLP